jgi:hypothetical protein
LVCWRPRLLGDEQLLEQLRFGGVELSAAEIEVIVGYLREVVLPKIQPGQRMLSDFSVTSAPDDGTFHRDALEKNGSLHHDTLAAVIEFFDQARAPVRVA